MLSALSVRDIVLIEALDLVPGKGLTAITGETGAGKSILLNALGLVMGSRGEARLVRHGASSAQVSAVFSLPRHHPARLAAADLGFDFASDEDLVLRRTLTQEGRSRVFINDLPASVSALRAVAESLMEIHGQHDGRGLMDAATHRRTLDRFGGHETLLSQCRGAWSALKASEERLAALTAAADEADADKAYVEHCIAELEDLCPVEGEEEQLVAERSFLMGSEKSLEELSQCMDMLEADGGVVRRLSGALAALERAADRLGDPEGGSGPVARLLSACQAMERATIEAQEAVDQTRDACLAFEPDPDRLEAVETRLFALRAASRKHGVAVAELSALLEKFRAQAELGENAHLAIEDARQAMSAAKAGYKASADRLNKARTKAAEALDSAVARELPALKLDLAQFRTCLEPGTPGPSGTDQVRFEIRTNPGAPFDALDKIASGGELSRIALALKVALSHADCAPLMVFDEIDQGVGGAVAHAIGKRLARLSEHGQVLVVTHAPQVAAVAGDHWRVEKALAADGALRTSLTALRDDRRDEELARMLSGENVTDAAREAARALLKDAA